MKGIASPRQLKVSELIKRNLGLMFTEGFLDNPLFNLITFTEARVSADLKMAVIFVDSINNVSEVVAELNKRMVPIRKELAGRLNLKFAPELSFKPDESVAYAAHIENLLNSDEVKKDLKSES